METKPTLTIGMPAYNEEANIESVIKQLLKQESELYTLQAIIVSSDGSSDATVEKLKKFDNKVVKVIDNKDRKGVAARQNQIIESTDTDILVMIDADIKITDEKFIDKLVSRILEGADLVSPNMLCTPTKGVFESIVAFGMHLKNSAFESYRQGNNIYTCHGAARAFSKKLYKNFRFGSSIGEDAYSYLYAISNSYRYAYAGNTTFYIKCPNTFKDHLRQSTRNFNGMKILATHFDPNLVKRSYELPLSIIIRSGLSYLIRNPFKFVGYAITFCITFISSNFVKQSQIWEISKSSKVLN